MPTVDLREHIHREIARAAPLDAFMLGLVSAMQTDVAPEWDWGPFRGLVLDDTEALRADGLLPAFAAAKRTTDAKVVRVDFEAMDLYFALTPTLEPPGVTVRRARLARSGTVARIVSSCRMPDDTSPDDGRPPVMVAWPLLNGYAAMVTALLLETSAKDLPFEHELEVAVSNLALGRVDRAGFVPTPAALAAEGIRGTRARDAQWLAERQGPSLGEYVPYGGPTGVAYHRRFRAEDGRTWRCVSRVAPCTSPSPTPTETPTRPSARRPPRCGTPSASSPSSAAKGSSSSTTEVRRDGTALLGARAAFRRLRHRRCRLGIRHDSARSPPNRERDGPGKERSPTRRGRRNSVVPLVHAMKECAG